MNKTKIFEHDSEEELAMAAISASIGGLILVLNFCLLMFIVRVLILTKATKDRSSLLVQTCFVSTHDTFSGFFLMLIGLVRVHDVFTAHVCAYLVFMCFAVQIVSQGNITCACAQRYMIARNLGKTTSKPRFHTLSLFIVNGIIGAVALVIYISGTEVDVNKISPKPVTCNLGSVVNQNATAIGSVNFFIGIPCLLVANVMCILTILKLRHAGQMVAPSDMESHVPSSLSKENTAQLTDAVRRSTQLKQNKAIFTLLLIVLFFNISIIPILVAYVFNNLPIYMSFALRRSFVLSLFFNSLFNPIIIVARVQDIRTPIKTLIMKAILFLRNSFH